MGVAAQFGRQNDDRGQHHEVEHHVFHDGDGGRCAESAGVSVGGQNQEGSDERPLSVDAHHGDHLAHADELQRDVRHGGQNPRERHCDRKPAAAVPAFDEVGQGYVTVLVTYLPEARQHQHHVGIQQNAIRDGEEAEGAHPIHRRRHRNHRVGGVEISADQKPRDERAEAPAGQSPLFQAVEITAFPARGEKARQRDQGEADTEDDERDGVNRHGKECLS